MRRQLRLKGVEEEEEGVDSDVYRGVEEQREDEGDGGRGEVQQLQRAEQEGKERPDNHKLAGEEEEQAEGGRGDGLGGGLRARAQEGRGVHTDGGMKDAVAMWQREVRKQSSQNNTKIDRN